MSASHRPHVSRFDTETVSEDKIIIDSLGTMVPYQGPCNCDECKPMREYLEKEAAAANLTLLNGYAPKTALLNGYAPKTAIRAWGASNPMNNGIFRNLGTTSGRLSPLNSNMANASPMSAPKAPWTEENHEALKTLSRRSVRPGRKRSINFRILDHGPNWKDQRCTTRFSVIRWIGPTPYEWERVGWSVSDARFADRKEANQAKRDLIAVAGIMES